MAAVKTEQSTPYSVDVLMEQARVLAANYRKTTGKTLAGVSGELAVYDAIRLLNLKPVDAHLSYEAIGTEYAGDLENDKIQVKGRTIFSDSKASPRIGQIKTSEEWDSIVLVLLNDEYTPFEIYEVDRETIEENAQKSSSNRSKRGAMTVARFKKIATLAWCSDWAAND
ncbi:MAG: hypothetical protein HQL46_07695 [Gammaproteobacteria bacterium]|nr:hypothetical protein [Gammaproteobacteria bacterium]